MFKITDIKGNIIPLNVLNSEVSEFWNFGYPSMWAAPIKFIPFKNIIKRTKLHSMLTEHNWMERISDAVNKSKAKNWIEVRDEIEKYYSNFSHDKEIMRIGKAYMRLLKYFSTKGYQINYE